MVYSAFVYARVYVRVPVYYACVRGECTYVSECVFVCECTYAEYVRLCVCVCVCM